MKKLWAEYSALLVRTKISIPLSPVAATSQPRASAKSAVNARIQDIGARWACEARAIQFDFEFKAVEQERRRVAKELHDESLPLLARLIRAIQSESSLEDSPLIEEVRQAISAFRDLLGELHPVDLEELGLVAAIDNICKRYVRICDRFVLFFEQTEECHLSQLQQLCLYRAMQALLKMFAESHNDMLMVNYNRLDGTSIITVRCADKLVSSALWITAERADFDAFEAWCALAGAKVQFDSLGARDQFPNDIVISVREETQYAELRQSSDSDDLSQARLSELDAILVYAKDEWARLINRDRVLFENLAVESERKKICEEIDRIILPRLNRITYLASQLNDDGTAQDVSQRMSVIASGVSAVMSDLHPRLLAEAGLLPSIQALVDRFRRASLIESTVSSNLESEQIDISQDAKFAIYRVTQEALNNIEKHSSATHAVVVVEQRADVLQISIEDNGTGFQGARNTLSRGLKNIRDRAAGVGAAVDWQNAVSYPSGTIVTISLRCLT